MVKSNIDDKNHAGRLIHMLSHHGGNRITRNNAQHDKDQQHHAYQNRDGDQNPFQYFS